LFSVISLQQNNDESVAANETVGADAEKGDGGADEKSDQFIVTQEYIQDSTCPQFMRGV
jgi:hypothetical protein